MDLQYSSFVKTVFVLRHGKSDWQSGYGTDHDRPLAERGIAAAELMGRFLSRNGQEPVEKEHYDNESTAKGCRTIDS